MRKIMFLGDSLTAGNIGYSYLGILEKEMSLKTVQLINAGENGFTMAGLHARLKSYLQENSPPDVLVLEGGANDLLLPYMQKKNSLWDPFIRKLERQASFPSSNAEDFKIKTTAVLSSAFDGEIPQIFVCTIPCLGENLDTELNRDRAEYNNILKEVCRESSNDQFICTCLDFALEVEPILKGSPSQWLFSTPQELVQDAQRILQIGEDALCRERGLYLTIDGAHLNKKGAQILSSLILSKFREHVF